ncbi:hypothetical protein MKEN_00240800 [Mycena kentingensis (nom. inval.)]|nr:hypothetical protein MKEN_00240800 [Mycena kentingensis (nom. inval.)]
MSIPPLIGDSKGVYRVHIVGHSGSGKSTLGKELASLLGVPYFGLDEFFWKPNWEQATADEFRAKLRAALAASPNGWVVDGNYSKKTQDIVVDPATDQIWLDPPVLLCLKRVLVRTFSRILRRTEPCSPGCYEGWKSFFSRDNIILYTLEYFWVVRRREGARFAATGVKEGADFSVRKMRRFGGWGGELRVWLAEVREMVRSR